jgi:hypothetical protein
MSIPSKRERTVRKRVTEQQASEAAEAVVRYLRSDDSNPAERAAAENALKVASTYVRQREAAVRQEAKRLKEEAKRRGSKSRALEGRAAGVIPAIKSGQGWQVKSGRFLTPETSTRLDT